MTEPSRPSVVQNCRRGFCAAKPNVTAKSTKPVRMAAAFMDPLDWEILHHRGFRVAMTHSPHVSIERAVAMDPKRMRARRRTYCHATIRIKIRRDQDGYCQRTTASWNGHSTSSGFETEWVWKSDI